jgi:hypothetical protein
MQPIEPPTPISELLSRYWNDHRVMRSADELELRSIVPSLRLAPTSNANRAALCAALLRLRDSDAPESRELLLDLLCGNFCFAEPEHETILPDGSVFSLERELFYALLRCSLALVERHALSLAEIANRFTLHELLPPSPSKKSPDRFSPFELMDALRHLERAWPFEVPFREELTLHLDVLLLCGAALLIDWRSSEGVGGITTWWDAKRERLSEQFVRELSWSLLPMYQRLALRQRIAAQRREGFAELRDPERHRALQDTLIRIAEQNNRQELSARLRSLYFRCNMRPSEMRRFAHQYPGKAASMLEEVVGLTRGVDAKARLTQLFNQPPWIIAREQLLSPRELDLLLALLLNEAVSAVIGQPWLENYVQFNVQLLRQPAHSPPSEPTIVQDFNEFNLLDGEVLYEYGCLSGAYLHWVYAMYRLRRINRRQLHELEQFTPAIVEELV